MADVAIPKNSSLAEVRAILGHLDGQAAIAQALSRMDRARRVLGQEHFSATHVVEYVRVAFRDRSRLGFGQPRGHVAMTIQRAKNREFPNVIVVWPHSVTGSSDHLRRLLYNAVTRARNHCTVIVLGSGRLDTRLLLSAIRTRRLSRHSTLPLLN